MIPTKEMIAIAAKTFEAYPGPCTTEEAMEAALTAALSSQLDEVACPADEWHEDMGDVLWWVFPIAEPPYVGSPLDTGYPTEVTIRSQDGERTMMHYVGKWPGYHTHWTPIRKPLPPPPTPEEKTNDDSK